MCTHATEQEHRNVSATIAIAEDRNRPLAERQKACRSVLSWGVVGTPQPMGIDPEPPCRLVSNGKDVAYKLWKEELSPQAQGELARRAAEDPGVPG